MNYASAKGNINLIVGYQNNNRDATGVEFSVRRDRVCVVEAFPYRLSDKREVKDSTLNSLVAGVVCGTASLVGLSDRLRELGLEKQADIVYSTFLKQQQEQQ